MLLLRPCLPRRFNTTERNTYIFGGGSEDTRQGHGKTRHDDDNHSPLVLFTSSYTFFLTALIALIELISFRYSFHPSFLLPFMVEGGFWQFATRHTNNQTTFVDPCVGTSDGVVPACFASLCFGSTDCECPVCSRLTLTSIRMGKAASCSGQTLHIHPTLLVTLP